MRAGDGGLRRGGRLYGGAGIVAYAGEEILNLIGVRKRRVVGDAAAPFHIAVVHLEVDLVEPCFLPAPAYPTAAFPARPL